MADLNIFTEATQKEILEALKLQNSFITILANRWNVESFQAVQEIVRGGGGPKYFPIGTQFNVAHSVYGGGSIIFDVVDHDGYKAPGNPNAHTMTLLMHNVIYGRQFDAPEALYAVAVDVWPDGMPAGTYNFTLDPAYDASNIGGKTLQFTTTKVVPVGGVLMFTWGTGVAACKISSYAARANTTALESNLQCAEGSGGTALGTTDGNSPHVNHGHRIRYGSNHYGESALEQWLNSDGEAGTWWEPQTEFDRPCSYTNVAGFLNGLDPNFLSIIGEVDVVSAYNTVFNVNGNKKGSYVTRDKFFLPSMTEVGFGKNNSVDEGQLMAFYNGATNTDRIKYDITNEATARYYFLRSAYPSYAYNVRNVNTSGALNGNDADNGNGAAAACVIY